jgi:hypothetical protein
MRYVGLFLVAFILSNGTLAIAAEKSKKPFDPTYVLSEPYLKGLSPKEQVIFILGLRDMSLEMSRLQHRRGISTAMMSVDPNSIYANHLLNFLLPLASAADKNECWFCGHIAHLDENNNCLTTIYDPKTNFKTVCPPHMGLCNELLNGEHKCASVDGVMDHNIVNPAPPSEVFDKYWAHPGSKNINNLSMTTASSFRIELKSWCTDSPDNELCRVMQVHLSATDESIGNSQKLLQLPPPIVFKALGRAQPTLDRKKTSVPSSRAMQKTSVKTAMTSSHSRASQAPASSSKMVDAGPPTQLITGIGNPADDYAEGKDNADIKNEVPEVFSGADAQALTSRPHPNNGCEPLTLIRQVRANGDDESQAKLVLTYNQAQRLMCQHQSLDPAVIKDAETRINEKLSELSKRSRMGNKQSQKDNESNLAEVKSLIDNLHDCQKAVESGGQGLPNYEPKLSAGKMYASIDSTGVTISGEKFATLRTQANWTGVTLYGLGARLCDVKFEIKDPGVIGSSQAPTGVVH